MLNEFTDPTMQAPMYPVISSEDVETKPNLTTNSQGEHIETDANAGNVKLNLNLRIAELQKLYTFLEPEKVSTFLEGQPAWINSLQEARRKIQEYFPLALTTLRLSLVGKPLRVVIDPRCEPLQAVAILRRFDSEWWFTFSKYLGGKLSIILDREKTKIEGGGWAVLKTMVGTYDGTEDWSIEHDHYLYGTPKQFSKPE